MSERKVLNKYYPPDYDPSKIPRIKGERSKQFCIRVMAPFNMRCDSCGEYIYKGKKFNSRMENVEGESYLGIPIRRFYIKCPRCVSEITFRTDPESVDYAPEHGATRLFEALRTAEKMAEAEEQRKLEEEANNPMKQLEKRTTASQREIEMLETLEELKELNARHAALDHDQLIDVNVNAIAEKIDAKLLAALEEEEDERIVKEAFGGKRAHSDSESDNEEESADKTKKRLADVMLWKTAKPASTSTAATASSSAEFAVPASTTKMPGMAAQKLGGLVVRRKAPEPSKSEPAAKSNVLPPVIKGKKPVTANPAAPGSSIRGLALQYGSSSGEESN